MQYQARDWAMEVPNGWECRSDEECVTITTTDGQRALQVSCYYKDSEVVDEDLRDFAEDAMLSTIRTQFLSGFFTVLEEDGRFWKKWWLRSGSQMFFVTYNCELPRRKLD